MAVRCQHATPVSASASLASAGAPSSGDGTSSSSGGSSSAGGDVRVDPRLLPSTIPGITQEELAARIAHYHSEKSKLAGEASAKALAQEIELMRRSLSPNAFVEYMGRLETQQRAAAREDAKMAAMSPVELHQYQQKKRRQAVRYEWYKMFLLLFAIVGSTAFLFSLFLFFE
ncbi:hypothetical protein NESM_000384900 [Novymonas esmeraldas]|uniref:Transmembrane protein n=1 Tax=Novymonas esmeraldas TaxID=1808958 RepID=A0AAW0EP06_9TRYP